MTISKIDFFDCLSEMNWNWREQSQSFFENLILYKWCEGRSCEVCLGYVSKGSKSELVFSKMRVQCEEDE